MVSYKLGFSFARPSQMTYIPPEQRNLVELAALFGNMALAYTIAYCHRHGLSNYVDSDERALEWFKTAAGNRSSPRGEGGLGRAQYMVAMTLLSDRSREVDQEEVLFWLTLARRNLPNEAAAGDPESKMLWGFFLLGFDTEGIGNFGRDLRAGIHQINEAAKMGWREAKWHLGVIIIDFPRLLIQAIGDGDQDLGLEALEHPRDPKEAALLLWDGAFHRMPQPRGGLDLCEEKYRQVWYTANGAIQERVNAVRFRRKMENALADIREFHRAFPPEESGELFLPLYIAHVENRAEYRLFDNLSFNLDFLLVPRRVTHAILVSTFHRPPTFSVPGGSGIDPDGRTLQTAREGNASDDEQQGTG